jgi:hypothetical protein
MIKVLVTVLLFYLVWFALMIQIGKRHQARMLKERSHLSLDSFVKEFEGHSYDREVIEAAYSDIAGWCHHPIRRRDQLVDLGFDYPEGEDMLEERCEKLGVPDVFHSPYKDLIRIETVDDYVGFLSAITESERKKRQMVS